MEAIIASVIVALIASSPGILALILQRKKDKTEVEVGEASAAEKIQGAALKMMEEYKKELEIFKGKVTNLENRVRELECILNNEIEDKKKILIGAWQLHDQIIELQGTPKYIPPVKKEG